MSYEAKKNSIRQNYVNWASKFNRNKINNPTNAEAYTRLINSIPQNPTNTHQLRKAIIARYLLNLLALQWQNARNATRAFHNHYGRAFCHCKANARNATRAFHNHYGRAVQNRIPNKNLVNFVLSLTPEQLAHYHAIFPFYA